MNTISDSSRAIGKDSESTTMAISKVCKHLLTSISAGQPKWKALESLTDVFEEACQPGWDGYGAAPVLWETYIAAKRFIENLSGSFPGPEVAADPDGNLSLEWHVTPRRMFWVSIGPDNFLHYLGVFGSNKTRGGEVFIDEIPQAATAGIHRVYATG